MSQLAMYVCDVCGNRTGDHSGWFTLRGDDAELQIAAWDEEDAKVSGVRHACSAEHVEKLVYTIVSSNTGSLIPLPLKRGGWDPAALECAPKEPLDTEEALLSVIEAIDGVLQSPTADEEEAMSFDA